jgi:hypothetical protein
MDSRKRKVAVSLENTRNPLIAQGRPRAIFMLAGAASGGIGQNCPRFL